MKIDSADPMAVPYADIKAAFESVYSCLGITCAQVGGIYVGSTTYYAAGAEPCNPVAESVAPESEANGEIPGMMVSLRILAITILVSFVRHAAF